MMNKISNVRIKVIGIGGGGGNAVNRMMESGVNDIDLVAVNTDAQVLNTIEAHQRMQIGTNISNGLGAGGIPDIGRKAAEESQNEITDCLNHTDMLFITAGMGGGTGTGASPVIAKLAHEARILTVGIVTRPFSFEGRIRQKRAEDGIKELKKYVDTLIEVPNDRLLKVVPPGTSLTQAFRSADDVLHQGVHGIADLITKPGLINLDFADIETTMKGAGTAMMGIGEGEGEGRIKEAARNAISSPLLDCSIRGARRVIMNITGGDDLTLEEVNEAATLIRQTTEEQADIFFGTTLIENFNGVRITVVATGFREQEKDHGRETADLSANAPEIELLRRNKQELDIPTFLRRHQTKNIGTEKSVY